MLNGKSAADATVTVLSFLFDVLGCLRAVISGVKIEGRLRTEEFEEVEKQSPADVLPAGDVVPSKQKSHVEEPEDSAYFPLGQMSH
jgi:hypothetical protein